MSSTMGSGSAMGTPHPPTLKWVAVGVVVLFVIYHVTLGKK